MANILIDTGTSRFWVYENLTPDYYEHIKTLPLLVEPPIMLFGKIAKQNRDIGFFSNESVGYKYSGQIIKSLPLNASPLFEPLLYFINNTLNTNFNGILMNKYKDGIKYLGAHSDDESALDKKRKMVVGLSYGPGIRKFRIRDKKTNKIILDYDQKPGTLIAMEGEFQQEFKHEIPIQKKVKGERISLTFRHHLE